jgi:DNA-binding MarR family transcriptional regulator
MVYNYGCISSIVKGGPMPELELRDIDIATLAWIAGSSANERLLATIRRSGHPRLRNSHGYVFQHLLAGTPTVGELAELLGVTQQAASKSVVELEGLGYVERRPDPLDGRIRRLSLTARGRRAVRAARAARADLERELVATVGSRAMAATRRTLAALIDLVGARDAVAGRRVQAPSD